MNNRIKNEPNLKIDDFSMNNEYLNIHKNSWEEAYVSGKWEYLKTDLSESHRYCLIHNYFRTFIQKGSVLDLGCGEGNILRYFTRDEIVYYKGVDICSHAIHTAKTEFSWADFENMDLSKFSETRKYEMIILNEILYYLPDTESIINKYSEYLTSNGIMVVSLYYPIGTNRRTFHHIIENISKILHNRMNHIELIDDVLIINLNRNKRWNILMYKNANNGIQK